MKAETESKLWWAVLFVLIGAAIWFFAGCGHAAALTLAPLFKFPVLVGFWSASSSSTKQESTSLQSAADNGAVNFGATYISGTTGGASASANSSNAGGTRRTRANATGSAGNSTARGGNTGVINQDVAATGQYGTAVGAGADVQTGGIQTGSGSTVTIAEPTEAVAALNAALAIGAAAQNTSESVALEVLDHFNGVGTGTGRGVAGAPGDSGGGPAPASHTQYFVEFGIVLALVVAGAVYLARKNA